MIGILIGLAIWCPAIVGWGIVARNASGRTPPRSRLELADIPAGYLALTGVALAVNFFTPITASVSGTVAAVGLAAVIVAVRRAPDGWHALRSDWPLVALMIGVAYAAAQPVHYGYDAGLYHLQTMRWVRESPVPLGLANLSGRFGYNSAWLPLAALVTDPFDAAPLEHAILLPATTIVFALFALLKCMPLARTGGTGARIAVVGALALVSPTVYTTVNSTMQDIVPLVGWIACAAVLVHGAEHEDATAESVAGAWRLATMALVAKLSAAPLLLMPFTATWFAARHADSTHRVTGRTLTRILWLPAVVVALWSARSVALSGCAVFPVQVTCAGSLRWAIPPVEIGWATDAISAWARDPAVDPKSVAPFPGWVPRWFARVNDEPDLRVPAALIAAGIILLALGPRRARPPTVTALVVITAIGVVFWFSTAPDPRFGAGPLWTLGAVLVASSLPTKALLSDRKTLLLAPVIVMVAWIPAALDFARVLARPIRTTQVVSLHIPIVQTPPMRIVLTQAGDTIRVPREENADQCFLAALPCAGFAPGPLIFERNSRGQITEIRRAPRD